MLSEEEIVEILDKYRKDNLEIWRIPSAYECEQLREAIQGLLDLYNKEKEKNKKIKEKCKELIKEKEELTTVILYDNVHKDKIRDLFDLTINQFIEERYIGGEHLIVKVLKELRKELLEESDRYE